MCGHRGLDRRWACALSLVRVAYSNCLLLPATDEKLGILYFFSTFFFNLAFFFADESSQRAGSCERSG